MNPKILFVDDEPNVLAGYERQLRRQFTVETAPGGLEGLHALNERGPFAVVVSDMRMPVMDGAQFLARVRTVHPDTVRLLLTGYSDVKSAIDAVNNGGVFRFLTKPCEGEVFSSALRAALEQHRLLQAERELLAQTLRGCVQILGEVLALANPTAFGQVSRLQQHLRELGQVVPGADAWEIEVAATLCQVGCVALPESVLAAFERGDELSIADKERLESAPEIAIGLIRRIPRLEKVIDIIQALEKRFDSFGSSEAARSRLPFGARVLAVVRDFDQFIVRGVPKPQAVEHLRSRTGRYDPEIVSGLADLIARAGDPATRLLPVTRVSAGMVLAEDLHLANGMLLLRKATPITAALMLRLESLALRGTIPSKIRVSG